METHWQVKSRAYSEALVRLTAGCPIGLAFTGLDLKVWLFVIF